MLFVSQKSCYKRPHTRRHAIASRRIISPTELLVRHFLCGTVKLDRNVDVALISLHQWVSIVLAEGLETALTQVPGAKDSNQAVELVSAITDHVVPQEDRIERAVLCKSIEETFFFGIGPDPLISRSEFDVRFMRFLQRHGISGLFRILLSLHLFNVVWLRTEKSFRMLAGTEESFQRYMEEVESTCRRIVRGAWRSQRADSPSTGPLPDSVIESIEGRLWGVE